ncbi:MAG: LysR substrate-binding domain-containing protein [Janthinobacterium lividum]
MDRLQAMQVFTRVVESNSFSKAAETLNLPRASVSKIIQNLESTLRVQLLQRTTRSLALTADGAAYYERCVRIIADVEETESSLLQGSRAPHGKLRIDMPGSLGRLVLLPALRDFRARYPEIDLVIGLGDKPVDLVQEGIDCTVRVGALEDSGLVARRVAVFQALTCASAGYLEEFGVPETLDDLQRHVAVNYFSPRTGRVVDPNFVVDGQPVEIKMTSTVSVNDADAYLTCGIAGFGLVQIPHFMALPYLHLGGLVEVLPQWRPEPMPISVVYPRNRHLSPKVRVFVDWLAELFEECPLMMCEQARAGLHALPATAIRDAAARPPSEHTFPEAETV